MTSVPGKGMTIVEDGFVNAINLTFMIPISYIYLFIYLFIYFHEFHPKKPFMTSVLGKGMTVVEDGLVNAFKLTFMISIS